MKGFNLTEAGKYEEAIVEFRKVTQMKDDEYLVNHYLGQLLLMTDWKNEKNSMDEAIKVFRINVKLKPKKAEAHFGLAASLYSQSVENVEEAEAEALLCLKFDPEHQKCKELLKQIGVDAPGETDVGSKQLSDARDDEAGEGNANKKEANAGDSKAKKAGFEFPA